MAQREVPYLKILMFNKGAEPYFGPGSDPGYGWFSNLANENKFGTFSYNEDLGIDGIAQYAPTCEYIGTDRIRTGSRNDEQAVPVGLVLRPFIVPTDVGNWNELPGSDGDFSYARAWANPPAEMLIQRFTGIDEDTGDTVPSVWAAESDFGHPQYASFCFTILPGQVSADYDPAIGGVPFYQFGWSSGLWNIRFFSNGNPVLMRTVGGFQIPVMELSSPGRISAGENNDLIVGIVRHQRGGVMISMDHGASYDVFWDGIGGIAPMPAGHFRFSGVGISAALGVHRVVYLTGNYLSPQLPMERARAGQPAVDDIHGTTYPNTDYDIDIVSPGGSNYIQYRLNLTRGIVRIDDDDWYFSPEVYATEVSFPVAPSFHFALHDFGATFENRILKCTVEKPPELSESSASWTCRYFVSEGGPIGDFALRKVQIIGGWLWDDGSNDATALFTGYITDAQVVQEDAYKVTVQFEAQGILLRPKRMQWRDNNAVPYDGLTPNEALHKWSLSMGLDDRWLLFDDTGRGDTYTGPAVFPEHPTLMPVVGEPRNTIMEDIAEAGRLKLTETNDGYYALVPNDLWRQSPYIWDADPVNDSYSHIESVSYLQRILDTFTGILVRGQTMWGGAIAGWVFDLYAETDILSSRFRPWSEWHVETIDRPVTAGYLGAIAASKAYDMVLPRFDMNWKGELAQFISRKDAVWVRGTTVGSGYLTRIGVESYRHVFDKSEAMMAYTELTGRRL